MAVRKLSDIAGTRTHSSLLSTDKVIVPVAAGDCLITVAELQQALGLQLASGVTGGSQTLAAGYLTPVDMTSGSGYSISLPSAAALASGALPVVAFYDSAGLFDTKNLTVLHGSVKIGGVAADLVCNARNAVVVLVSDGTHWLVPSAGQQPPILTKTSSYTTLLSDANGMLLMNSASNQTFTIDSNANVAYPIGTTLNFGSINSGQVTIALTGDTLNSFGSVVSFTGAGSFAFAIKTAATTWQLFIFQTAAMSNAPLTGYQTGTAYTLTNSQAQVAGGTTSAAVTLTNAGTYLLLARADVQYVAATYAANQTCTLKLRRTNNTAADVANSSTVLELRILTTITDEAGMVPFAPIVYTATAGDIIQMFAAVSAAPSAGSVQVTEAALVAIRLY